MTRRAVVLASLALIVVMMPVTATATTLRALTLPELVAASALVVHARVVGATDRVVRTPSGLAPRTRARFAVIAALHGEAPRGELALEADVGTYAPGARRTRLGVPRFATGDEVVLFLRRDGARFAPVAMGQGVFRVLRRGDVAVCTRALDDVELVGDTSIPERISLTELVLAVRDLGGGP